MADAILIPILDASQFAKRWCRHNHQSSNGSPDSATNHFCRRQNRHAPAPNQHIPFRATADDGSLLLHLLSPVRLKQHLGRTWLLHRHGLGQIPGREIGKRWPLVATPGSTSMTSSSATHTPHKSMRQSMEVHSITVEMLRCAIREIKGLKWEWSAPIKHLQGCENLRMAGHLPHRLNVLMQPRVLEANRIQRASFQPLKIHMRFQFLLHLVKQREPVRVFNLKQAIPLTIERLSQVLKWSKLTRLRQRLKIGSIDQRLASQIQRRLGFGKFREFLRWQVSEETVTAIWPSLSGYQIVP